MAKVLVTEEINPAGIDMLLAASHEVVKGKNDPAIVIREITDADAVLTRIYELPVSLLETAKNLKLISKHGVGYDNIPLDYCKEHGIAVTITPGANSLSVAEHAFTLMMALSKHTVPTYSEYRRIGFAAKNYPEGMEVTGKTLGIIGIGNIGSRVAHMAVGGFDMKVLAYDPYVYDMPAGVTKVETLDELLAQSDCITLHCLLTDETRKMIGKDAFAKMKDGVIFINCARGPIVDEAALIEALKSGKVGAAGLDVTDPEPISPDNPLWAMPNVILTPHFAPTTKEAALNVSAIAAANVNGFFGGGEVVGRLI